MKKLFYYAIIGFNVGFYLSAVDEGDMTTATISAAMIALSVMGLILTSRKDKIKRGQW